MQITVTDRQTYKITHREFTDEGFLRVPGKVARTGIQQYLASELGLPGDPNRLVNVYRPEEEVFDPESLASYAATDVTLTHPDELVNSKNYNRTSKGVVTGPGERTEDNFVLCNLLIKAQDAVDAVINGTAELSAGYTAIYEDTPGTTPDGAPYEYKQTRIRINHVAIVDRARAGAEARIFDSNKPTGGLPMPVNITLDSGRVIDVADAANAQLVADAFDRSEKRVKDAEAARDSVQALYDAAQEQITELKLKSNDEAVTQRVKQIAAVTDTARKIAGENFSCDSLDVVEIQRAAMQICRPKTSWADKSATYIEAAFDAQAEKEEEESMEDAGGRGKQRKSGDFATYEQLVADAAKMNNVTVDAYQANKNKIANAWKGAK